uniref:Uncharacterized protein n=1 Tax=Peronospora matthiolae TaxID=2874970 RepID=A0AAV1UGA8_9STRA
MPGGRRRLGLKSRISFAPSWSYAVYKPFSCRGRCRDRNRDVNQVSLVSTAALAGGNVRLDVIPCCLRRNRHDCVAFVTTMNCCMQKCRVRDYNKQARRMLDAHGRNKPFADQLKQKKHLCKSHRVLVYKCQMNDVTFHFESLFYKLFRSHVHGKRTAKLTCKDMTE